MKKENKMELDVINAVLKDNMGKNVNINGLYTVEIAKEAIGEALIDTNIKKSIQLIVKHHPYLIPHLRETIEEKFPEYIDYLDKVLVLI